MTWFLYDNLKVYIGEQKHTAGSPIPSNSTDKSPPVLNDGEYAVFIDGEWLVVAELPQPIPEPIHIPQSLKMAQCRAQLIIDGKDDDVELLINSIEDPIKQKLYRAFWEYEPIVLRDNAMINEMAPALAIDLDEFFVNASKL